MWPYRIDHNYLLCLALFYCEPLGLNDLMAIHLHRDDLSHRGGQFMALGRRKVKPLVCLNSVYGYAAPLPVDLAEQVLGFARALPGRSLKERSRLGAVLRSPLSSEIELR